MSAAAQDIAATQPAHGQQTTVLYVAGSGRTGSTVLSNILGTLDGFFAAGELCNLWERGLVARRKCGCGARVDECGTWSAVLARAAAGQPLDAARLAGLSRQRLQLRNLPALLRDRRRMDAPVSDAYRSALARLYAAIPAETGCRVIVDSSKSPLYAEQLASLPGLDVHLVHLVRDPRATAYSFRRNVPLPDFDDERLMVRQHPATSARRWAKSQPLVEALWRGRPDRYLRLRYEDFIRDPRAAVREIAAFVGQAPELPFVDERTIRLRPTHSVSGNPNRFSFGEIELRLDDEWISRLSTPDRLLVTAMTWPLLLRYGYPVRATGRRPGP